MATIRMYRASLQPLEFARKSLDISSCLGRVQLCLGAARIFFASVGEGFRLTILVFALLVSQSSKAEQLFGIVVGVADGDTLTLLDEQHQQHKIRLAGIDAPEKKQPYGQLSKAALSQMTFGRSVSVDWNKRDKYVRIIGKIIIENQDINLEQLKLGLAWWYRQYAHEQSVDDRSDYEAAENVAKINKSGLWQDESPTPPSAWRKVNRKALSQSLN